MEKTELHRKMKEYYGMWREMNHLYEEWAKECGMSYYSLLTLYAIWESREECSQKQICERWTLAKQTVNMILKEFEEKGILTTRQSENDRRIKLIAFTESGEKYAGEAIKRIQDLEERAMERLGSERSQAMIENMRLFLCYFREGVGEKR